MTKTLVLAEKPSVARDIARVLGARGGSTAQGFIESDEWVISWALGHLVALCEPDAIDPRFKPWRMDTLPILPESIPLHVLDKTKKQFAVVKKLMHRRDISRVVCATDSGREGELIFRYIYAQAECKKPFDRLWISSMTDEAIREGFAHLRPGSDYENLYQSARCRSEADWLVGMNASRAYSIRFGAWLSVGRVQTPTLALICARDAEIAEFKPEDYFEVQALFGAPLAPDAELPAARASKQSTRRTKLEPASGEYVGTWRGKAPDNPTRIPTSDQAQAIADQVRGQPATVASARRTEQQTPPPQLYDLTSLQRDANRLLGLSAKQTLDTAQSLYERHKLLTYPRTDSRYMTRDMAAQLPRICGALCAPYDAMCAPLRELADPLANRRIFDDARVSDHHAIIPTARRAALESLTAAERAVYDLVTRRFAAAFYPPYRYLKLEIVTRVGEHEFISRGSTPVDLGWKQLYRGVDDDEREPALPNATPGEQRPTLDALPLAKKTQPPKPYTDATLLQAMEGAGRALDDEELREAMRDSGLGTPATRAATIERLLEVGYCERTGKSLRATPKAFKLISVLPEQLRSAETTGRWERALGRIARGEGQVTPDAFLDSIRRFAAFIVDSARSCQQQVEFERQDVAPRRSQVTLLTGVRCPVCGARIQETARAFGCERWREGCRFTLWKDALERDGLPALTATAARKLLKGEDAALGGKLIRLVDGRPRIVGVAPAKASAASSSTGTANAGSAVRTPSSASAPSRAASTRPVATRTGTAKTSSTRTSTSSAAAARTTTARAASTRKPASKATASRASSAGPAEASRSDPDAGRSQARNSAR
ncbi:MAG TPA: DNA topoisomerase 3 [Candidatus Fimadaptatus faecigallinarum]|uniref:DNA topoisomerase n=1 Tax=Candidatus Fimadaptatus faecigallinarum TaxID=2840814 RepID=A0A9D1S4W0_9FIRM|nr:DNA topoisomerase 3 [Candidatus Fimadaptatus faecigallinarum]